jgi:hypothetical protein
MALAGQLRDAVGGARAGRLVLVHRASLGPPVDVERGGEDDALDAARARGREQGVGAEHVGPVYVRGPVSGEVVFLRGEVHEVRRVAQHGEELCRGRPGEVERHVVGARVAVRGEAPIHHPHGRAGCEAMADDVPADEAGTAGHHEPATREAGP